MLAELHDNRHDYNSGNLQLINLRNQQISQCNVIRA